MQVIKQSKVIAQLPEVLEKNCLYYVRVGQGFDLYVTDSTGSIAYKQNTDDIITTMLNQLDKTGQTDVSGEFLKIVDFQKKNKIPLIQDIQAKFSINQNFNLRDITVSLPNVEFVLTGQDNCITIGGNSNIAINPPQIFGKIMRSDFRMQDLNPRNRTNPTCKIIGAKGQNITIQQCDYLQLFCSTDVKDRSIAYCNFNFDVIIRLEITTDPNNPENLELWCNENNFYLKRCYALDMTGSYRHNCNLFIGGGFENQYGYINLEAAAKNRFLHTRLEGIGQITFGEQSEGNVIERAYFGSTNSLGIIPVTDNGVLNRINTLTLENSVKTRIVELTENTPKWNNSVANPFTEVSEYLRTSKTWYPIFTSPTFKMKGREDYLVFDWDNTAARYMITVEFFDDVGNKINPSAINFNSPFLTYQANKQWLQGNHFGGQIYGTRNFTIMAPGEYNVKVSICSNSKLTEQLSKRFTVDMYSNRPIQVTKHEEVLSAIPTQFLGKSGDSATLLDGRRVVCTGSKADTIVGFNAGAKSITSTSVVTNQVKSGAIIQIKNGDGTFIWKTVANTAGTNSLVLTDFTGISSPFSYKAFNLEYSEPASGAAYDDTLVKQQIDSIIAINRQQEERLDVIAKKQESSSDLIVQTVHQSYVGIKINRSLNYPKSDLTVVLYDNTMSIVKSIFIDLLDKSGSIVSDYELSKDNPIILSGKLENILSPELTLKYQLQLLYKKLRIKVKRIKIDTTRDRIELPRIFLTGVDNLALEDKQINIESVLSQLTGDKAFRSNYYIEGINDNSVFYDLVLLNPVDMSIEPSIIELVRSTSIKKSSDPTFYDELDYEPYNQFGEYSMYSTSSDLFGNRGRTIFRNDIYYFEDMLYSLPTQYNGYTRVHVQSNTNPELSKLFWYRMRDLDIVVPEEFGNSVTVSTIISPNKEYSQVIEF